MIIRNKIIKWSNIDWNKGIYAGRILFPNHIEAEIDRIDYEFLGTYCYYTLKFIYNFVDEKAQKDFLIGCYEVFELMQKNKKIRSRDIEFNTSFTSRAGCKGRMCIEQDVEIRFGV